MLEKNVKAKDCVEFVQYLRASSFPDKDVKAVAQAYPLPEKLREHIGNKRIVLFHIGKSEFKTLQTDYADYIRIRLDYLRESLAVFKGVFLWWYDDGIISKLIHDLMLYSKADEAQALQEMFEQEQRAFNEGKDSLYDASGEEERALAWADVYLGDNSSLRERFISQGKASVLLDFSSLHDGAVKLSLDEWLDREVSCYTHASMEGWQDKVRGKRVLLYCLSASTLIHRGISAIEKIFSLSECIHDGLIVWWFYDERIDGLLPYLPGEIRKKYQEARHVFVQSGGLIDESGCAIRAADMADACYMDSRESIRRLNCDRNLCMIPWVDKLPNYIFFRLRFLALYMDDEYIYFVPNGDRGTFWGRMRLADGTVDVKLLKDEDGHGLKTKIVGVVPVRDKLLAYPMYGSNYDELYLYDPKGESYEVIKASQFLGGMCCPLPRSFRNICKYKNKLFAGIWSWPKVIVVDLDTKKIKEVDGVEEVIREADFSFADDAGFHLSCILKGHFYVIYYNHNFIFDIDAEQEKIAGIIRLRGDMQIRLLETDGDHLWLGTAAGEIVRYDVSTGNYSVYEQRMPLYRNEQYFCNSWMIYYEGAIHFFCTYPSFEPETLYTRFNIQKGEFSDIKIIDNVGWLNELVWADGGKLLVSSKYKEQNKAFLLDLSDMSILEWEIKLSPAQEAALKQQILRDCRDQDLDAITEGVDDVTIKDFAEYCLAPEAVVEYKSAGRAIYDFIIGQV